MSDKIDIDNDYIKAEYLSGKSATELSEEIGCSPSTILRRLKKLNVPIRTNAESHKGFFVGEENPFFGKHHNENTKNKISKIHKGLFLGEKSPLFKNLDINYIIKSYTIDKKSTIQIAKELNCSKSVINDRLRKSNIKIKTCSEAKKGKESSFLGKHHTEKARKILSENAKKNIGPKNPNWKGGISYLPYCPKFNESLKEEIRDIFGRKCYICDKTEEENKEQLSIHHIDYNKNSICNGKKWAFLPLCRKCHAKTNGKRYYYFNLLINYWAVEPEIAFNPYSFL